MIGGLIIMLGCCGTPRGVNHNDKTVMINPTGAYHNGRVNENLTPEAKSPSVMFAIGESSPQLFYLGD